ncbi:MAG: hypothetical protein FD123_4293 [Bacteroidetes bacterium]|nr:MAG: hypothetical protein FD123_4293 [Bacteroidota bacterium]
MGNNKVQINRSEEARKRQQGNNSSLTDWGNPFTDNWLEWPNPFGGSKSDIKAKMEVSQPGDASEMQADAVADAVMRGDANAAQVELEHSDTEISAKASGVTLNTPPGFDEHLQSMKGGGMPLDEEQQDRMEEQFGVSLDHVRLHTGEDARELTDSIDAKAFAHEDEIFAPGEMDDHLLAHEITHTLQKGNDAQRVHRAMKFELQTENYVWRVNSAGGNPMPLGRKYSPSGGPQEDGDEIAYLSKGVSGEPAKPALKKVNNYVKVERPLVMKDAGASTSKMVRAKDGDLLSDGSVIDMTKPAQYVVYYRVKKLMEYINNATVPDPADIIEFQREDKNQIPSRYYQSPEMYNAGTYEFRYFVDETYFRDEYEQDRLAYWDPEKRRMIPAVDLHAKPQPVYRDKDGIFKWGDVPLMIEEKPKIDEKLEAQFIKIYKVKGDFVFGEPVTDEIIEQEGKSPVVNKKLELVKQINNAKNPAKTGLYHPNSFEFRFYRETDFDANNDLLQVDVNGTMQDVMYLDIHLDQDRRFQPGHKKMMVVGKQDRGSFVEEKEAQFIEKYKIVKTPDGKYENLEGERVSVSLVSKTDNAQLPRMNGMYFPGETEKKYYYESDFEDAWFLKPDAKRQDIHLNEDEGKFEKGHVEPKNMQPQFQEIYMVNGADEGTATLIGKKASVVKIGPTIDNTNDALLAGKINMGKWRRKYYKPKDFDNGVLKPGTKHLDVHVDAEGKLQDGYIKWLEINRSTEDASEQTAIELQSESHSVIEFETPKWFRKWSELKARIQEAYDMTVALSNSRELTSANAADKKILEAMATKIGSASQVGSLIEQGERDLPLGTVREWPFDTSHLTALGEGRLLVEIVDPAWHAFIQSSEGIPLSEYESLHKEHERPFVNEPAITHANNIFNTAFAAAKTKTPSLQESLFENLKGFIQLIATYIIRGQVVDLGNPNTYAKAALRLMARTDFASMYKVILSEKEKVLFKSIVEDVTDPILTELNTPISPETETTITKERGTPIVLGRGTRVFYNGQGETNHTSGPTIYEWLSSIHTVGDKEGNSGGDKISEMGGSNAIGAKTVSSTPGKKDFKQALFETRGTVAHGGRYQPASNWISYAEEIFKEAAKRSADTPDDPSTPDVNEASNTGLIYDP